MSEGGGPSPEEMGVDISQQVSPKVTRRQEIRKYTKEMPPLKGYPHPRDILAAEIKSHRAQRDQLSKDQQGILQERSSKQAEGQQLEDQKQTLEQRSSAVKGEIQKRETSLVLRVMEVFRPKLEKLRAEQGRIE
ncbi:hypothetical protein HY389_00865, partial [Candidatus Daviesbacteria bacterium]|nr:hypothetical protein [Candidatus Daviesbacteria bacterium]